MGAIEGGSAMASTNSTGGSASAETSSQVPSGEVVGRSSKGLAWVKQSYWVAIR